MSRPASPPLPHRRADHNIDPADKKLHRPTHDLSYDASRGRPHRTGERSGMLPRVQRSAPGSSFQPDTR